MGVAARSALAPDARTRRARSREGIRPLSVATGQEMPKASGRAVGRAAGRPRERAAERPCIDPRARDRDVGGPVRALRSHRGCVGAGECDRRRRWWRCGRCGRRRSGGDRRGGRDVNVERLRCLISGAVSDNDAAPVLPSPRYVCRSSGSRACRSPRLRTTTCTMRHRSPYRSPARWLGQSCPR